MIVLAVGFEKDLHLCSIQVEVQVGGFEILICCSYPLIRSHPCRQGKRQNSVQRDLRHIAWNDSVYEDHSNYGSADSCRWKLPGDLEGIPDVDDAQIILYHENGFAGAG